MRKLGALLERTLSPQSGPLRSVRGDEAFRSALPSIEGAQSNALSKQTSRAELRIPTAAAQTRMVSVARIRLDSRKSLRPFKGIICDDISEFESYMPSHAVGLSQVRSPAIVMQQLSPI